jgi:hypothetical protein
MHKIDTLDPIIRSAVRDCVFSVLAHFALSNLHGPILVKKLFLMTADHLVDSDIIIRPNFLGGKGAGGQKFAQLIEGEQNEIFPNYGVPENIALQIRQTIWELYLQGILAPATKSRIGTEPSDKDTWVFLDAFMLTPYSVQILTDTSGRIRVHDPDGYLANFTNSVPPPDTEMMRYLHECFSVFRGGHLLASVILLAIASERLIEVLAESLRVALGDPDGTTWFYQKYAQKRDISARFKALSAKLMDEYGNKLRDEKLKEGFQSVVTLTFEAIRLARNDIAHLSGREFTWNEVSGFLHNFVQYYGYVNLIIKLLADNPKTRLV